MTTIAPESAPGQVQVAGGVDTHQETHTAAVWVSAWVSTPPATSTGSGWTVVLVGVIVVLPSSRSHRWGGTHRRASGQDSDGCLLAQAPMRSHRHDW